MAKTNIIAERFSSLLFPKGDVMSDLVILFAFSKAYSIPKWIKSLVLLK